MKKAIIFSVGFAGRAIYRKAKSEYEIIGFIDNNKNISGTKYDNITIYHVDELKNLDFDIILLGGIWHSQMSEQLLSLGVSSEKIIKVAEKDISYSTNDREKATDEAMKKLDEFLQANNVKYVIHGSSLISILRQHSLSHVTDVDIAIFQYENLEFLKDNLAKYLPQYDIKIVYFDKDTIISKKGDIRQIAISDNSDEKISFDIFCLFPYDNYLFETFLDKFFYFNKGLFQDIIRYQYKDFYLSIPKLYDEMLTHMYGKNYIIPPQTWSNNDYKNLITREELEELVNGK